MASSKVAKIIIDFRLESATACLIIRNRPYRTRCGFVTFVNGALSLSIPAALYHTPGFLGGRRAALVRVAENPSFAATRADISICDQINVRTVTYIILNDNSPRRVVRGPGRSDPRGFVAIFARPLKSLGVIEIANTIF